MVLLQPAEALLPGCCVGCAPSVTDLMEFLLQVRASGPWATLAAMEGTGMDVRPAKRRRLQSARDTRVMASQEP